jgi:Dolichyl-phosphate-mannose-protein mannosyltransferase
VFLVAALLQARLATRPGIWVDEIFSLAMATGHSLEHPAVVARPDLGDFIEHPLPGPPATLAAYATHDSTPAGPSRVVRAVFLSDTSPPLYYLLLSAWTRLTGTSDAALRLFSALSALVCLPLVWLIGCRIGDRATGLIACTLFAFSPPALYYASEGRMYALTWVFTLSLAWLALRIERDGPRWPLLATWALAGAAGLLTHYFFTFVWVAVVVWLWLHLDRPGRTRLAAAVVLTGLLILPWYARVPESLGLWRITAGWSNGELSREELVQGPVGLARYMLFWRAVYRGNGELFAIVLYLLLVAAMLLRGPRRWVTGRPLLLWLWLAGAAVGPVIFDLLLGTTTSRIGRYGLAGLPATILLVALGTSAVPRSARAVFTGLLIVAWVPGYREVFREPARWWQSFPDIAARLDTWHGTALTGSSDLVLVHSIPSGSIGVARYLTSGPPLASWTVRLNRRSTPAHLDSLLAGRCRVALVKVHDFLDPSPPAEGWLRDRATFQARDSVGNASILYFALRGQGAAGFPARCGSAS